MIRKGITLTEALVALFIAALGMISLLTLFPLGAMQMGQALKDSRTAQAAQEADGLLRTHFARYETDPSAATPLQWALDYGEMSPAPATLPPTPTGGISFPVLIDPLGYSTTWPASVTNYRLATGGLPAFPRRTLYKPFLVGGSNLVRYQSLFVNTNVPITISPTESLPADPSLSRPQIERYSILQDELDYDDDKRTGAPTTGTGKVIRGAQYTWSWLVQRPNNARRGLLNLQILVFFKRSPFYGSDQLEVVYKQIQMNPTTTKVSIPYTGTRPEIAKGRWIMDCTTNVTEGTVTTQLRHANFYRVVSVNDDTPGTLFLELETPIRRSDGSTNQYSGQILVFKHLSEVFERPPLVIGEAGKAN